MQDIDDDTKLKELFANPYFLMVALMILKDSHVPNYVEVKEILKEIKDRAEENRMSAHREALEATDRKGKGLL